MKNKKNATDFEIKKKLYSSPELKIYGTFSEYTKGQPGNRIGVDNQNYYGSDQTPTS